LWARTRLDGSATLGHAVAILLTCAATFGLVLGVIALLVRPKRVAVGGVVHTGFVALLPVVRQERVVSFVGRLTFDREGVTWFPGKQARKVGYTTMHWSRADIEELRVERVRNLTPLGYLHVRQTGSTEAAFRVFQPKRLRSLTAAFTPLLPGAPRPSAST
jgi:hypothetical protein